MATHEGDSTIPPLARHFTNNQVFKMEMHQEQKLWPPVDLILVSPCAVIFQWTTAELVPNLESLEVIMDAEFTRQDNV